MMATDINEAMKLAAAEALASMIPASELKEDYIIPNPFDEQVAPTVAAAVAIAAMDSGVSRVLRGPDWVKENARNLIQKANRHF